MLSGEHSFQTKRKKNAFRLRAAAVVVLDLLMLVLVFPDHAVDHGLKVMDCWRSSLTGYLGITENVLMGSLRKCLFPPDLSAEESFAWAEKESEALDKMGTPAPLEHLLDELEARKVDEMPENDRAAVIKNATKKWMARGRTWWTRHNQNGEVNSG